MSGAASRKRAISSGHKTKRDLARLVYDRQVPAEVETINENKKMLIPSCYPAICNRN
jgi:hypothetical protein